MVSSWGQAPDTGDACAEPRDEAQRAWGHVAPNISNPDPCLTKCQELFYERLIPQYNSTRFNQVCEALSVGLTSQDSPLRELYCCDSLLCGVDIVNFTGQDPNVLTIINQCQRPDYGGHVIEDPGHPSLGSVCPLSAIAHDKDGLPCERNSFIIQEIVPDPDIDPGILTALTIDTKSQPPVPSTSTSTSRSSTPSTSISTSSPSSAHPAQSSPAIVSMSSSPSGPTPGAKAAVAVCSSLALLLIVAVIFCCLRRHARAKRYRSPSNTRGLIEHPIFLPGSSPTPLMSPSYALGGDNQHVPLSPPPRLRERRLLYSVGGSASDKTISVPGTPTAPPRVYSGFTQAPPSPKIGGKPSQPGAGKNIDERELGLMMQPVGLHNRASGRSPSLSSLGSRRTTTASGCSTAAFSLRSPSPQALSPASPSAGPSPLRPPRPHDAPLEIPDLVRPDWAGTHIQIPSPPPNRALPPAPVGSPSYLSPSFQSAMRHRQNDDIGVAIGIDSRTPAPGDAQSQGSSWDLGQGTDQRRAADHDSWGSWGGGGPGVTFPSPTNRETGNGRGADSFVMDEADLERLAGRY